MNKNGQTLVIFVFLIPLFIMMLAIVVDLGLVTNANIKYLSLARECVKIVNKDGIDKGKLLLDKNGLDNDNYEIAISNNEIEVKINTKVESIFGSIINIKEYDVNVKEKGMISNG